MKTFEQEALDKGMAPEDAKVIGKVADFAYEQELKKVEAEATKNCKTLHGLLRTPAGCALVLAELLIALENHDMITPEGMKSCPEALLQVSDIVVHIVKSRETKEGWTAVKFP